MNQQTRDAVYQQALNSTLVQQRNQAHDLISDLNARFSLATAELQETQALLASTQGELATAKAEIESLKSAAASTARDVAEVPSPTPAS